MENPKLESQDGGFEKKFNSPQEEISYLREKIAQNEKKFESSNLYDREQVIKQTVDDYSQNSPEAVLEKGVGIPEKFREEIVLDLAPEEHDQKMSELLNIVMEKGVITSIDIVSRLNDPHLQDDFHRFLIQYLKSEYSQGGVSGGSKESGPLISALNRTLFEIIIPEKDLSQDGLSVVDWVSKMEQFYYGMQSMSKSKKDSDYMTIEIANPLKSKQFIFYISVANDDVELLQKQLLSVFPDALIREQKNDFNVFNSQGVALGSYVTQAKAPAKTIRTIDQFSADPMDIILNVFSNLHELHESAAIQIVFKPVGNFYISNYLKALNKIDKGEKNPPEMFVLNNTLSRLNKNISNFVSKIGKSSKSKNSSAGNDQASQFANFNQEKVDQTLSENLNQKIASPIVSTNIRVVTSAATEGRAEAIMKEIESAFNQFQNTKGNYFKFDRLSDKRSRDFFRGFSFRNFNPDRDLPLNLKEISTVVHLPQETKRLNPQLKVTRSGVAPAPIDLNQEGILLGYNDYSGVKTDIHMSDEDRLRHFYIIGQTGTGKTNFMKSMVIQDIQRGEGVCMIDPHGNDIQDILASIPESRRDDVIYFDPAYTERPMGLNMLEYDPNFPEQKTFVVNELFSIFQKLYGANPESMGPMFEQYFRNATMLVIEDPSSGNTLLDVSRVLSDRSFRQLKLANCKNPVVVQFWKEVAEKAGGEAALSNIVPYITSKFDVFLANDIMRPVVAQEKSSFNFRHIMDEKKILLVNLSKGRLGDINSNLIGLILVGKILMAALSRVDSVGQKLPPFYLYIDEFQNITTSSISTILSEARKYALSLNIAHQYISQLDEKIKDSVFGNVGSMAVFRVGSDDAQYLENQFKPTFSAKDIMNIDNYNCYLKMLSNGVPQKPFSLKTFKSPEGQTDIDEIRQLSYMKYGRNREDIESEILRKYQKESLEDKIRKGLDRQSTGGAI